MQSWIWDLVHEQGVALQELVGNFVETLIICRSWSNLLWWKPPLPMDQPISKVFPTQTIPCSGTPCLMSTQSSSPEPSALPPAGLARGCCVPAPRWRMCSLQPNRPPASLCWCRHFHLPLFKSSWLSL